LGKLAKKSQDPPITAKAYQFPKSMLEVLEKAACYECGKWPSPGTSYICDDGHLFCADCGEDRCVRHDSKCRASLEDLAGEGKVKQPHFTLCQNKIQLSVADPLYTSLWVNTYWNCPNQDKGCTQAITGRTFYIHWNECNKKYPKETPSGSGHVQLPIR